MLLKTCYEKEKLKQKKSTLRSVEQCSFEFLHFYFVQLKNSIHLCDNAENTWWKKEIEINSCTGASVDGTKKKYRCKWRRKQRSRSKTMKRSPLLMSPPCAGPFRTPIIRTAIPGSPTLTVGARTSLSLEKEQQKENFLILTIVVQFTLHSIIQKWISIPNQCILIQFAIL